MAELQDGGSGNSDFNMDRLGCIGKCIMSLGICLSQSKTSDPQTTQSCPPYKLTTEKITGFLIRKATAKFCCKKMTFW